jgi:citrate lyase beta subunit
MRSMLFVPGDRPERFAKAAASGADAVILDLEDAVVAERRPYARAEIVQWLASAERRVPVCASTRSNLTTRCRTRGVIEDDRRHRVAEGTRRRGRASRRSLAGCSRRADQPAAASVCSH